MSPPRRFSAVIHPSGLRYEAPESSPLLTSAREAGIDLPASSRNGTCRTCMCRLASGHITYRIEWPGLTREEKAEGFILPCVAHPESDVEMIIPGARYLKERP
jgi:ferredoxin